ncbi:MAG: hypothetical protein COB38_08940 [Gammaproteobacteria bacterium]|nr:MAG: hypothetical protein COB38_08940 [Gammaproteobacteria bacterium]
MKFVKKITTTFLLLSASLTILADEPIKKATLGQTLHDGKCLACHTTDTYTREDHTMKSLEALSARVTQCMNPAKAEWNDKERKAVVSYISKNFYKF